MKKQVLSLILILCLLISAAGCSLVSNMPFNGAVTFHSITLTVPYRFLRDTTQSNTNFWVFARDNYSEYVLISRSTVNKDAATAIDEYVAAMQADGADSQKTTFLGRDAVLTKCTIDNVYCQEILFLHDNSFYAVALRGGDEAGFKEITDTIACITK
ncbi:MAG: hypothetical protein E7461_06730 [Ruminococcaceae bacterium]|nr:hypothetical protein [Oscillospiraceae bacterium]